MVRRAGTVEKARAMVGVALSALGAEPDRAAFGPDTWLVSKGSAAVVIRVVGHGTDPDASDVHVQVTSPVMRVPPDPGFSAHLLKLNHEMGGLACFAVTPQGEVHLVAARTYRDVGAPEIARLIAQVAHFSDAYDDPLLERYGAQYALRPGAVPPRAKPPAPPPALRDPGSRAAPPGRPPGKGPA